MSDSKEDPIMKVRKVVGGACNDLQALQDSHRPNIPPSLRMVYNSLDQLSFDLRKLADFDSDEALAIFCASAVKATDTSTETLLPDALVHDIEAMAMRLKSMMPSTSVGTPGELKEHECQDIADMVNRYDRMICSVIERHKTYVSV
jgi:hypothetical protein